MQPIHEKRWRLRAADPGVVRGLVAQHSLDPLIARVLVNRGMETAEAAGRFLSPSLADLPDPFLLPDMDRAVARLARARQAGETVCVYGDYDVDGITAVALLIGFFRTAGISCLYHIPRRLEDGYGLSADGLQAVAAQGASVVVTVDCGISAVAEAGLAADLGLDLIVTDHHTPGPALPAAYAVINPLRSGSAFPCTVLAGVGVAFNLLLALRSRLREEGAFAAGEEPDLRHYLDLVALGTIADIVPLLDANRALVRTGLKVLTAAGRPGIAALKAVAGVDGEVSCGAVGFRLAPRLNAAGRLEDAAAGVELLLTQDRAEAARLAAELDASNAERQALEREILQDALHRIGESPDLKGRKSIVLASADWHPGVIGIVASRVVDLYHRPTILIALQEGSGRGSGRSIPGFHLYQALHACADHLLKFGGHRQAAGLSIVEETLAGFVERFDAVVSGELANDELVPDLWLDGELLPSDLELALAERIAALSPFGAGNPEPLFLVRNARIVERRVLKDAHLKLRLAVGERICEAIGFSLAARELPDLIDCAVAMQVNIWNGRRSLQLRIKDLRPAEAASAGIRETMVHSGNGDADGAL
ncbi:MAG: single-stranded-DNA-specific exonuclease RecJ [Geobacter sp.]|nr:single-stranded-DNA-specific exonuclease RecJ [Geobacter sp.]